MSSFPVRSRLRSRRLRPLAWGVLALIGLYGVLSIPEAAAPPAVTADRRPFRWERDRFWEALQHEFERARAAEPTELDRDVARRLAELEPLVAALEKQPIAPDDSRLDRLEGELFDLAPLVAAVPERIDAYLATVERARHAVKEQSRGWDLGSAQARERLYRALYGSRAALEEVLLQAPPDEGRALVLGTDEPSVTPALEMRGVRLHSGDILVSRGAAPTSALIARGHDLPGNFSHVALLHVDEHGEASVIEAHIERGVAVSNAAEYLGDRKLRILVLRPRADLPALVADPLLPHEAASAALADATARHIPYDFAMDVSDPGALFCSEVASAAYHRFGVELWAGRSSISSPGIAAWLAAFGVRRFETQEPSDLEYDPQLACVAEWRDAEALFDDHLDNAVMDVLLESAESGEGLAYDRTMLPLARCLKTWSVLLEALGRVGPVPEGMSATAALRNQRFVHDHAELRARVAVLAAGFQREHGYRPPYWELVRLAREARAHPG